MQSRGNNPSNVLSQELENEILSYINLDGIEIRDISHTQSYNLSQAQEVESHVVHNQQESEDDQEMGEEFEEVSDDEEVEEESEEISDDEKLKITYDEIKGYLLEMMQVSPDYKVYQYIALLSEKPYTYAQSFAPENFTPIIPGEIIAKLLLSKEFLNVAFDVLEAEVNNPNPSNDKIIKNLKVLICLFEMVAIFKFKQVDNNLVGNIVGEYFNSFMNMDIAFDDAKFFKLISKISFQNPQILRENGNFFFKKLSHLHGLFLKYIGDFIYTYKKEFSPLRRKMHDNLTGLALLEDNLKLYDNMKSEFSFFSLNNVIKQIGLQLNYIIFKTFNGSYSQFWEFLRFMAINDQYSFVASIGWEVISNNYSEPTLLKFLRLLKMFKLENDSVNLQDKDFNNPEWIDQICADIRADNDVYTQEFKNKLGVFLERNKNNLVPRDLEEYKKHIDEMFSTPVTNFFYYNNASYG
jgi:hypothetical protein